MDAYDIYHRIKQLWSLHTNKSSGMINKSYENMRICVWTSEGYREVVNAVYNDKLNLIELELDQE